MGKLTTTLLAGSIFASSMSLANDGAKPSLSYAQKLKVAWALRTLMESRVIKSDINQCLQLDQDIFDLLEQSGSINKGGVQPMAICPDAGA